MKPVTVAAFNTREEAEPLYRLLCAHGISAAVRSESSADAMLQFARPAAGVLVEVPRECFETALQLVYSWNTAADAVATPQASPTPTTEAAAGRTSVPGNR
jgi:hypothetical protein